MKKITEKLKFREAIYPEIKKLPAGVYLVKQQPYSGQKRLCGIYSAHFANGKIDNDNRKQADKDADIVKILLDACDVPEHVINSMQIISDFNCIPKGDARKLLFSGDYIVCTFSMYTTGHYNSLGQMVDMLMAAGRNNIKDIVYVDGSGKLLDALTELLHFDELKGVMALLNAIETNQIITFKDADPFRIRVCLQGYRESSFKLEAVDLKSLLTIPQQ